MKKTLAAVLAAAMALSTATVAMATDVRGDADFDAGDLLSSGEYTAKMGDTSKYILDNIDMDNGSVISGSELAAAIKNGYLTPSVVVTSNQNKLDGTYPKASGYKSYHMIVTVPVYLSDRIVDTKVEIQIRTVAMDFWASLEHKIHYKFEGDAPEHIKSELVECAKMVSDLDSRMLSLNEEILAISHAKNIQAV